MSLSPYEEQLWHFRRELFGWFVGLMLALLVTLAALLRWVLAPVRRMEREIHEVEEGRSEQLGGGYPRELAGVASNLNALLDRRAQARRPLSRHARQSRPQPEDTARGACARSLPGGSARAAALEREIDRMSGIIEHQLKRAAASGGALLGAGAGGGRRRSPRTCAPRC